MSYLGLMQKYGAGGSSRAKDDGTAFLGVFREDVTPPLGHPLCGGWYQRGAEKIADRLFAKGLVFSGANKEPVVICVLDWCEMGHADHTCFRRQLAVAAETSADRVFVHCLHTHEAPWPDSRAHELAHRKDGRLKVTDPAFFQNALARVAIKVRAASRMGVPVTHLGMGRALVQRIASNRRILGKDGRVRATRWTATTDEAVRAEPEGVIDPMIRTLTFRNAERKIATLHFYATHPNSFGGMGEVTKDFAGLARERREHEDLGALHIYFTGAAGNVTAGKYNDGSFDNREVLAARLLQAMARAEESQTIIPFPGIEVRNHPVLFPPREDFHVGCLEDGIGKSEWSAAERIKAAMKLSYLRQYQAGEPTPVGALHFGRVACLLSLPGEPFVEYQLFAGEERPEALVAVAGYGDCSVGYVPLAASYAEGGYEPQDSFISPRCEELLKGAIREVLAPV